MVLKSSAAVLLPSAVLAADLPEPVIEHYPAPVEFEQKTGGWYLRGDIGYKVYKSPSASWLHIDFNNEELEPTGIVGVGVGYRFSDHLRTDVTLDYEWKSDFSGDAPCQTQCGTPGVYPTSLEYAEMDVWTVLWNVYAELGNYNGFTPYVGAGVGASYVRMDKIEAVNGNGARVQYEGDGHWNFSWALMAGMGYEITPNWTIDTNYRYLNIGMGKSVATNNGGATSGEIKYEDLQAHEVRVGLRYTFGNESYGYQEPLVTKY
ncbi:porin family protein [Rhodobacteraceae bacterium RKSG542]|nr:porin family protein [Pseudovibrio flavus]